ncbi:M23 family metallopeptidase [Actinoplanes oblitus]|uniref:M23 family metallopeptidase n=1 Tax=Actinoplanes oblitus TaxID=3040509 RepID=A0ABY8WM84_9ACTN|nr:M23 family metallopeptidase [Actinoplanes oblitus]WIM98537.1 M23 family metallopeptidase [Actinoplanes oblitus]
MRKFVAGAAAMMSALALTACGGKSEEPYFVSEGSAASASAAATAPASPATAPTGEVSSAPAASASASPSPTASPSASKKATAVKYFFPVVGNNSYARTHHDYPATDLITDCGNKFRAVTDGEVLAVSTVDKWKASVNAGATRGGLSISILGDDGVRYYGSHLSKIAAGVTVGARVTGGQTIGRTGDTGDASACHLHFGISPPCARSGDWWNQRGTVYPWPFLDSWKAGKNKSPVAAVKKWKAANGCPTKPTTFG